MRMAELSAESGVPVATIKYYLREGLLSAGERTSPNQARYDEHHVRRLKLVRALLDVGGLSIASARKVVDAIDEQTGTPHHILALAHHNLGGTAEHVDEESRRWALDAISATAQKRGWKFGTDSPAVVSLVNVLCSMRRLDHSQLVEYLDSYAEAADRIAEVDFSTLDGLTTIDDVVEQSVVGTVLGDVMIAALRRIAQQNASARRYDNDG